MFNKYINLVKSSDCIIIYGAGVQGKRTLSFLRKLGMEKKVICFAKSDAIVETYILDGIEVRSIFQMKEYYDKALFLVSVSDQYLPEIKKVINKLKIKHCLDARKLYYDSYMKSNFVLSLRKIRNKIYARKEETYLTNFVDKQVTHITYCLATNAGDTMLSQCVRRFLRFHKWHIIRVTQEVSEKTIEDINASDALIIGGGGLFLPDTNVNSISGWQWAISEEQISDIKVPIIIFSVGYNYFKGQKPSEVFVSSLETMIEKASFIGLRNMGSVELVRSFLRDELKEKVIYQPCTTTLIRKIYGIEIRKNTKNVAFNVAFDREKRRFGENREFILSEIAKAAYEIQKMGYRIVYIAHCDDDFKFLPYLDNLKVNYVVRNLTQSLPRTIIGCYRNIEVTIGMRGHAQMIPFGVGGKIISLGTHDKMKWFLEDVNLTDCYVDLNRNLESICVRIVNTFKKIVLQFPKEMERRLIDEQERLWKISCKNRDMIIGVIKY